MPYKENIQSPNPTCFIFLIDQSGSMSEDWGKESGKKKADGVADAINRLLKELVERCASGESVKDRIWVGVIGYGKGGRAGPAFGGALANLKPTCQVKECLAQHEGLVPISEVASNPLRIEQRKQKQYDGAGGYIEVDFEFPIYFDPVADGGTPMCDAFRLARPILQDWTNKHPKCFPPIVVNITDGESTDGDPSQDAAALKGLNTTDGNVLVFNCHISSKRDNEIILPDNESGLPDQFALLLYQMSSPLPTTMIPTAQQLGFSNVNDRTRGFAFNADLVTLIQFLQFGTIGNLR